MRHDLVVAEDVAGFGDLRQQQMQPMHRQVDPLQHARD